MNLVVICSPIGWWWGERFDTPEHEKFVRWRDLISTYMVALGMLVYRPHEAFKGNWSEEAQVVNDAAIKASQAVLALHVPGATSFGTEHEVALAADLGIWSVCYTFNKEMDEQETDNWASMIAHQMAILLGVSNGFTPEPGAVIHPGL